MIYVYNPSQHKEEIVGPVVYQPSVLEQVASNVPLDRSEPRELQRDVAFSRGDFLCIGIW